MSDDLATRIYTDVRKNRWGVILVAIAMVAMAAFAVWNSLPEQTKRDVLARVFGSPPPPPQLILLTNNGDFGRLATASSRVGNPDAVLDGDDRTVWTGSGTTGEIEIILSVAAPVAKIELQHADGITDIDRRPGTVRFVGFGPDGSSLDLGSIPYRERSLDVLSQELPQAPILKRVRITVEHQPGKWVAWSEIRLRGYR